MVGIQKSYRNDTKLKALVVFKDEEIDMIVGEPFLTGVVVIIVLLFRNLVLLHINVRGLLLLGLLLSLYSISHTEGGHKNESSTWFTFFPSLYPVCSVL